MQLMRLGAKLATLVLLSAGFLSSGPAHAQGTSPTADQIEIFRNLPQDQQDAILKQLGGQGSSSSTTRGTTRSQGQDNERAQENEGTGTRRQKQEGEEEQPFGLPVLLGADWVIIEIDFRLPPRPLSPSLQALYLAQGVQSPQSLQALQGAVSSGVVSQPGGTQSPGIPTASDGQSTTGRPMEQPLSETELASLKQLMALIRYRNPYQLSRDGVLTLPGFAGIPLLGLSEDQATLRLKAEPAFAKVDIRLTRLPLKKSGAEGLKPFGYDLFDRAPSTFAPVTNVPVPADYIVGPGDQLEVQLYGNENRTLQLIVGRDGRINFPRLGPIAVAGQLFTSVKASVESQVARQMIGVRASLSMGDTRSIRIFVLGEAKRPGTYTVSGLGTITSALYAAGGVKPIGSLRHIQLKRQGVLVRTLDLYDLLIRGDTTDDTKLLPGDVIFVPPVGATVSAEGEVRRPAIYEIKDESSVADIVQLAGGLTAEADTSKVTLTRIDANLHRVVLQVEPSSGAGKAQRVQNGDLLRFTRLRPTLDSGVSVQGHVFTPGAVAYRDGLKLTDVIHSVDELQPNADLHYVLIRRELPPDRHLTVLSADLAAALGSPGGDADVPLMPRDRIIVFDLFSGRDRLIQPLLTDLRMQSNMQRPSEIVHVDGRVNVPGDYPLEARMTVADLVRAGGGLADAAYGARAELTRYEVVNGETRRTRVIDIDLGAALQGDRASNLVLQAFDNLSIKEIPEWTGAESVNLKGEVRFPGQYSIRRGETLKSVINRAGGLTEYAFPEGTVLTREELKRREQEQIDLLTQRMQRDLALLALEGAAANQAGAASALSVGQTLLTQLRGAKAVGRLVIDLPQAMKAQSGSAADVIMRDGDALIVPRYQQEVTVIGEVQNPTSHLYSPGFQRDDYIGLSGGATNKANRKQIYIVRANGSVLANSGNRWFESGGSSAIHPGDTVVVPLDTERLPPLPFWTAVTQIIYNVAIAAAAVHSF